jgi:hypothetical protein
MTHSKQPPDADGDKPNEPSALGKFWHACFVVAVTGLVAVFLVFGFCMIALSSM